MGGYGYVDSVKGSGYLNDVWYSYDGVEWTNATRAAPWTARRYHAAVVHNGAMWVIGGSVASAAYVKDVWCSTDGLLWREMTNTAALPAHTSRTADSFNGELWLLGGYDGDYWADAWCWQERYGNILANPKHASAGDSTIITFTAESAISELPSVTVNGHEASYAAHEDLDYTYDYTVQPDDPDGPARIEISSTDLGTTVTFVPLLIDSTPPSIAISAPSVELTDSGPVYYSVTYGDTDTITLSEDDITLNRTGLADGTVSVLPAVKWSDLGYREEQLNEDGPMKANTESLTVAVTEITGFGALSISIAAGTASDLAGNLAPAAGPSQAFAVDRDSDGDGMSDMMEGDQDPDEDTLPNYLDDDSDGDGIADSIELDADPDEDGTPNYLDDDSDGDGIFDADEGSGDPDEDEIPNFLDLDSDGDGIDDVIEGLGDPDLDTAPNYLDDDSDGDGILDADEGQGDPDEDEIPNFLDLDSDGDTVDDVVEGLVHSDDDGVPDYLDEDSDGDGMPDAYEAANGLSRTQDDTQDDADGDGVPNGVEYERGSGVLNADDPPAEVYVDALGSDDTGDGIPENPWATIGMAMGYRGLYAIATNPVTIHVAAGLYEERVDFSPYVTLSGAGATETVIQHFDAADDQHFVVVGADETKLEHCAVTLPGLNADSTVLVLIADVKMELSSVVVDGGFYPFSVGVQVNGTGSSAGSIHDCWIVNLNDGVWAVNSGIALARNFFDAIFRHAIFVLPPETKDGAAETPLVGSVEDVTTTGLNRFGGVDGMCVYNASSTQVRAELNDWGSYTAEAIGAHVAGFVGFEPYLGFSVANAPVVVCLRDAVTGDTLGLGERAGVAAWVAVEGLAVEPTYDAGSSLFVFEGLAAGSWTLTATAARYLEANTVVSVDGDAPKVVEICLSPGGNAFHTADRDGDCAVNLSELLRVIQFYNARGYHCHAGTEDGYAPGAGPQDCAPHASDYNSQDWRVGLSELMRLIQFYNGS